MAVVQTNLTLKIAASLPTVDVTSWRGVVGGTCAADARGALGELSLAFLRRRQPASGDRSLAEGEAGVAIAHAALARVWPNSGHEEAARRSLAYAREGLSSGVWPGLLEGYTGIAWAAQVLAREGLAPAAPGIHDAVADALLRHLRRRQWIGQFDLVSGLVGFGVYALERLPCPVAADIIERIVRRLAEAAERQPEGSTWRWCPDVAPRRSWLNAPPAWNLGLAHGVPGVIAFLGRACGAGVATCRARPLLRHAVSWLLARELTPPSVSCFAREASADGVAKPARLAWCYGDAGVAAALLVAGVDAGEPAWVVHALRIARKAAARRPATAGVVDASLCHGAAGLGHIFHRMYLHSGEPTFARAARRWFRRCLSMREGRRFGGFYEVVRGRSGTLVRTASAGFVTGAAGVAAALAAALIGADAAAWDRCLLLSGNPA
jgi:lantibiotic biosynthesis protein